MGEIAPLVRIILYIAGTWLAARGVPPEIAHYVSNDPAMIELASQIIGGLAGAGAFIWWRIAKRFGWTT